MICKRPSRRGREARSSITVRHGGDRIRTCGPFGSPVFKTGSLNHSDTPPPPRNFWSALRRVPDGAILGGGDGSVKQACAVRAAGLKPLTGRNPGGRAAPHPPEPLAGDECREPARVSRAG